MEEWKLKGSKLLLDVSQVEVHIPRYRSLSDLVSHSSLDNSRSLLCFFSWPVHLEIALPAEVNADCS